MSTNFFDFDITIEFNFNSSNLKINRTTFFDSTGHFSTYKG